MTTHDTPNLIPDCVVARLIDNCPYAFWVAHRTWYRWFWSWQLQCDFTQEETDEILSRINGYGPHNFYLTLDSLERGYELWDFWRNQKA